MTYYYEVYHVDNPDYKIILAFPERPNPMQIRNTACRQGLWSWGEYPRIRFRKTKKQQALTSYTEVRTIG